MSAKCAQCSEFIPASSDFCDECGAPKPKVSAAKPKAAAKPASKPAAAAKSSYGGSKASSAPVTTKIDCNSCSKRIPSSAKFCPECGADPHAIKAADVFASKDACTKCHAKIPPKAKFCPECGQKPGKAEAKAPTGVSATGNTCKGCGKGFDQGVYLTALGGKWHNACFGCQTCKKPIKSQSFAVLDGKPMCDDCAKNRSVNAQSESTLKCTGCGKGIMSRYVKPEGKPFHSECFKCMAGCGTSLVAGYVVKGDQMVCGSCADPRKGKPAAAAAAAQPARPKATVTAGSITCIKCFDAFSPTLSKCPKCGKPPTSGQRAKVAKAGGPAPAAAPAAAAGGGFCGECGSKNTGGGKFCGECGSTM